jgi:hypothetical protein
MAGRPETARYMVAGVCCGVARRGSSPAARRVRWVGGGDADKLRNEGDGVRVRVGCNIIYQGNTMRTIGSTLDGCNSLGYLGQLGLLCLLFFFFFFPFYCTIVN